MSEKYLVLPATFPKLEYADSAVGRSAGKEAATFMRRPRDDVHGSIVVGEIGHFLPLTGLLAPNKDFAVVRGGSDDVAVLRVSLGKGSGLEANPS